MESLYVFIAIVLSIAATIYVGYTRKPLLYSITLLFFAFVWPTGMALLGLYALIRLIRKLL
jgi:hypothetical protein